MLFRLPCSVEVGFEGEMHFQTVLKSGMRLGRGHTHIICFVSVCLVFAIFGMGDFDV